ncbi:MAG: YdcF family protein [Clostridia bacterium]|nr:YdcF family protein [Clostridia bacterium]
MLLLKIALLVIGSTFLVDGLVVMLITKPNMGNTLLVVLSVPLLLIGILFDAVVASEILLVAMWTVIVGYVLFFAFIVSLSIFLYKFGKRETEKEADVLIVLGMGLKGKKMLSTLKLRLDGAVSYLKKYPSCIVILSGGKAKGASMEESSAMSEYLIANGISKERIIQENCSVSTYENFLFSQRLIEEKLGERKSCLFMTSTFHVYRSQKVADSMLFAAKGLNTRDAFYVSPNNYLRECAALVQYIIKGKIKL